MGRPPGFDRIEVLDRAVDLFWARGYGGVAVSDLVGHLGLSRSSLYAEFGDKDGLFLAVLQRYQQQVLDQLTGALGTGGGLAAIGAFLDRLTAALEGRMGCVGCLIQRTVLEASPVAEEARRSCLDFLSRLEKALLAALMTAQERGELAGDCRPEDLAKHLLATIQGMVLTTSLFPDASRARVIASVTKTVMQGWAQSTTDNPKETTDNPKEERETRHADH